MSGPPQPREGQLSFEEWVRYCFERPESDPEWYFRHDEETGLDANRYRPDPVVLAGHLARLFETPAFLIERYSREQLGHAMWFICGVGSLYLHTARDPSVPKPDQIRWVSAILCLYRDLFSPLCTDPYMLAEPDPEPRLSLDDVCYMFWDMGLESAALFPGEEHLIGPIFDVLEGAILLDSRACQRSALHGLGHLQCKHEILVKTIIHRYLLKAQPLPELRRYARAAARGLVH